MKKRTRQQKEKAQQKHLQQFTYQYQSPTGETTTDVVPVIKKARPDYTGELFAFDVRLIYRDLGKTTILVIGIFILLGLLRQRIG